jgi:hypothetical protein
MEYKFHEGLKDVFLTVMRRVQQNLAKNVYPPQIAKEYRESLWLKGLDEENKEENSRWVELREFLSETKFNTLGILSLMNWKEAAFLLKENVKVEDNSFRLVEMEDKHVLLSVRDIPKEEGFIWINKVFEHLKNLSFKGKIAFAFVGRNGRKADVEEIYDALASGLENIENEPVHYYLHPEMYRV